MCKLIIITFIIVLYCSSILCCRVYCDDTQDAISTPILTTVPNFRDIAGIAASIPGVGPTGGTGFANPTSNNGVMRTGVFYRTDAPFSADYEAFKAISLPDQNDISKLNIRLVIDLRTPAQISSSPACWTPSGATSTNISIYDPSNPPPEPPFTGSTSDMTTYMKVQIYQPFASNSYERGALGQVLLTLAHTPGPLLFHCDAGKDRTGWTAAILESIAGVSSTTIMNDYLASNKYMEKLIDDTVQYLKGVYPTAQDATLYAFAQVDNSYLNAALDEVSNNYGSINAYLIQGLGLSQADIYVLRAKMVYYLTLPGQNGLTGNAAAGAGLLNALQNSSLSGNYTAFNYYLQSAIDAGTLGGVENQVGGQIYADTASFLLRLPQWVDEAIMPYTKGCNAGNGMTHFWTSGLGGIFSTGSSSSAASSTEYNAGTLVGVTHRFNDHVCADLGIGYDWGSVRSANARANLNTFLMTLGGRYGFLDLGTGPFMTARADGGLVYCGCTRHLDGGLGDANGKTDGAFYGGLAGLGDVIRLAPFTFTLQTGVRVIGVALRSFDESGDELALDFTAIDKTYPSMLSDLEIRADCRQFGDWAIAPVLTLGYEQVLTSPRAKSTGTIYDYSVTQYSAFDSRELSTAGLSIMAQRGAFTVTVQFNGLMAGAADSLGCNDQLSINYRF